MGEDVKKECEKKLMEINREIRSLKERRTEIHEKAEIDTNVSIAKTKKIGVLIEMIKYSTSPPLDNKTAATLFMTLKKELMI